MIVQQQNWAGIPLLHIYVEELEKDAPIVIFLHGFMSAKEHNLHYAYNLVSKGVRVILPDAHLHGERVQDKTEDELSGDFWKIVMQSVAEVGHLHTALRQQGFTGKLGVAGTSMGGIVTSGCLRKYDFIAAAGILMGIVSYTDLVTHQLQQLEKENRDVGLSNEQKRKIFQALQSYNLKDTPDVLQKVPTYFWHGEKDTVVPFSMTNPFYKELVAQGKAGDIIYVADQQSAHAVSRAGMLEMCHFIAHRLA